MTRVPRTKEGKTLKDFVDNWVTKYGTPSSAYVIKIDRSGPKPQAGEQVSVITGIRSDGVDDKDGVFRPYDSIAAADQSIYLVRT